MSSWTKSSRGRRGCGIRSCKTSQCLDWGWHQCTRNRACCAQVFRQPALAGKFHGKPYYIVFRSFLIQRECQAWCQQAHQPFCRSKFDSNFGQHGGGVRDKTLGCSPPSSAAAVCGTTVCCVHRIPPYSEFKCKASRMNADFEES